MKIRCVYEQKPPFPATDQHPDAVRHEVVVDGKTLFVDSVDDEAVALREAAKDAEEVVSRAPTVEEIRVQVLQPAREPAPTDGGGRA